MVLRGTDATGLSLFGCVGLEERIPSRHPLRQIRQIANDASASRAGDFGVPGSAGGRPSIAPGRLLGASLIQILFPVRSEWQLFEQMQYNLMFGWFVGLGIDDLVWVPTVFAKHRDRLLTTDIARKVLMATLAHREASPLLSDAHFSVDGRLVKARASMKSFQPKPEAVPPPCVGDGPDDPPSPPPALPTARVPHRLPSPPEYPPKAPPRPSPRPP